jgi:MFS family permease
MASLSIRVETEPLPLRTKLARVDWIGAFLFIGGTTSFLMGLSWAGIQFHWSSAATLVPIFIGLLAVAAAMAYEIRLAPEPFIRYGLFASRSALAAYAGAFSQGFSLLAVLYYITFYFTAVRFHSPIRSGVDLLPISVFFVPSSIVVSALCTRLGRFRWAVWGGWATMSLGSGLFLLFDEDTPTAVWAVSVAIFGVGTGMTITSVNVAIQAISKAEDCGRAAAMYAFMRAMGMSIGVAVGGTTFQNVMARRLRELGLPEAIAHNAEAFVHELRALAPTDPVRVGALDAYVKGFHGVFYVVLALALSNFLLSFAIGRHSMDKPLESDFVLKRESVMANVESKRQSVRQSLLGSVEPKLGHSSWVSGGPATMNDMTIYEQRDEHRTEFS